MATKTTAVTISVPKVILKKIDDLAAETRTPRSQWVLEALEEHLTYHGFNVANLYENEG